MPRKSERPKTKRLVVLVDALEHKRWGKMAYRAGVSTAEFVRRAVAEKIGQANGND